MRTKRIMDNDDDDNNNDDDDNIDAAVTITTTLLGCFGVSAPPRPISSQLPVGSGGTFTAFKLPFVHILF